jgi:hypothetical protein
MRLKKKKDKHIKVMTPAMVLKKALLEWIDLHKIPREYSAGIDLIDVSKLKKKIEELF